MVAGQVELNSVGYMLKPFDDGTDIRREQIEPFAPVISDQGQQRQQRIQTYTSSVFGPHTGGFGRNRIPAHLVDEPSEFRRFLDATIDTRWDSGGYLPILEEDSTHAGLEVCRASSPFGGDLWCLWEDNSGGDLLARKYVGSTTTWTAGGNVFAAEPTFDAHSGVEDTGGDATVTTTHTAAGTHRLAVVAVMAEDAANDRVPTGVTYGGAALTKAVDETNDTIAVSLWYRVAPTAGSQVVTATFADTVRYAHMDIITLNNVYPGNEEVAGATSAADTGTALSLPVTSTDGDMVIDAFIQKGTGYGNGPGTGQTERWDENVTGFQTAGSTKPATGTSTTMSYTASISAKWAYAALAVKKPRAIGLDLMGHKTHLLALLAAEESHVICRSTDGATWTVATVMPTAGLLANAVTANEDIDAGLLEEAAGEAIAVVWHRGAGTITFFSSSDAGNIWTDEAVDIPSGNGPQGVAVLAGIDNEDKLYVGTREGLWEIDTAPATWTSRLIFPMVPHNDNCRRMVVADDGALWFAQGVDDDSPPIIYRMFVRDGARQISQVPNDFSLHDTLPSDRLGPIRRMVSAQGMVYVSAGGGAASRNASIFCHNGEGWHSIRRHGTPDQEIQWIAASADDDGTPRLHYAVRTSSSVSDANFLAQAFTNPASGISVRRESTGYVDLPYEDDGMPTIDGIFLQARVHADDLSATTSGQYINLDYGVNGAARTTNLGDILSGTLKLDVASGAGVSAKNVGIRSNLLRDGTNTNTPVQHTVEVATFKVPDKTQRFTLQIDLQATADLNDIDVETVVTNLETARDLGTCPTFRYGNMAQTFVHVRGLVWNEKVDSQIAPDADVRRIGVVEVLVEEIIK